MKSAQSDSDIFRELCENDFNFFAKHYFKIVEPGNKIEWNWHHTTLCHYAERVYYGDIPNLDINIPPRTLKSMIMSVLFPCWVWTKDQRVKFICASQSYDLSVKFNMMRRELIKSEAYQTYWPIGIKADRDTAKAFSNVYGGSMRAASALGKITGDGGDILISDDLLDSRDAFSKNKRDATNQWYSLTFHGRVQSKKKARRININQRLHQQDVSGHIKENHENFKRLVIPMQMTEQPLSDVDFVDPRQPGEFMHPERYGEKEKEDEYKGLGVYGWSSQMQQSPVPIGGGIIKSEWIRYYKELPGITKKIITADLAFKGNSTSDYVSLQCWGKSGTDIYLIDLIRGRWSYKQTKDIFLEFCNKNGAYLKFIEDKANGPALISELQGIITGVRAWPEQGSKYLKASKVQRLKMCSPDYELGNVYFPEGISLVDEFVVELTSFTENGSSTGNDDMVDTSTMALLEFKKSGTFSMG